jgi:hypothetical protein
MQKSKNLKTRISDKTFYLKKNKMKNKIKNDQVNYNKS